MEREAFTIAQAVEAGGGSKSSLYDAINAGLLRARKRGRSTIILAAELREYLEALPVLDPKAPSRERAIGQHAVAVRHGQRVGPQRRGKK
jgi:hypothetical protein